MSCDERWDLCNEIDFYRRDTGEDFMIFAKFLSPFDFFLTICKIYG